MLKKTKKINKKFPFKCMLKNNKVNLTFLFEIKNNFEGEKKQTKEVFFT